MNTSDRLHQLMSRAMRTTIPATAITTAAVSICGQADDGECIAPINAVSHILWGDKAARQESASLQYTATGVALNTAAVASWSLVYELLFGQAARKGKTSTAVLGGVAVAGLAYVTDYYVVPKRLDLKSGYPRLRCWWFMPRSPQAYRWRRSSTAQQDEGFKLTGTNRATASFV